MELISLCPLRAGTFTWSHGSELTRTVVCKATFELAPGRAILAARQELLHERDRHWEEDPNRSLYAPNDLVPRKVRAEVLVVGHAFAPSPDPVARVVARVSIGSIDKAIEVHCDRAWTDTGRLVEGPWFTSMSLAYERAAGGPSTWNPVGVSLTGRPSADGLLRLPNLAPPGFGASDRGARFLPIGFGPIAPGWPSRRALLGPPASMLEGSFDVAATDLDLAFFNSAPDDQQLDVIRPDESILLEHLDREHPRLATALPGVRPRVRVEASGLSRGVTMSADTLWIDTDRRICTVTWRGTIPIEREDAPGRIVVEMEMPAENHDSGRLAANAPDFDVTTTDPLEGLGPGGRPNRGVWRPVLPFQPAEGVSHTEQVVAPPTPQFAPAPPILARTPERVPSSARRSSQYGPWSPPGKSPDASAEVPFMSALAASNAAASGAADASKIREASSNAPAPVPSASDIVELLFCDPAMLPRIRAKSAYKKVILRAKPRDDDGEGQGKLKEGRDARDVLAVLRHGTALDAAGLRDALHDAAIDGAFTAPLVLTAGTLELVFDEREVLKITLALVTPFSSQDKKLKELCETTRELLASPWIDKGTAGLESFIEPLREAFGKNARGLSSSYLESTTERILLEQRGYQKRTLLGEEQTRALFTPAGADSAIPIYLSESATKQLPLFVRFRARIVAELRLQLDQYETSSSALRCVALGRLLSPPMR